MDENATSAFQGLLSPGTIVLGRYKIETQLAVGGQAAVYAALDTNMDRSVAIKVISCEAGSRKEQRFQLEAKILAGLNHDNIVRVYAFGKIDDNRTCLVMERIEGVSLAQLIEVKGAMSGETVCAIFKQILDALIYLHANNILHRDIKPGNILIFDQNNGPHAKLVDFGIAKILSDEPESNGQTRTLMVGTPNYMSPEQCKGQPLDERSDLYSLACVLLEALTARPPFDGETPFAVMSKQTIEDFLISPSVPKSLALVIEKASKKSANQRYQTAAEMQSAILNCMNNLELASTAPGAWNSSYKVVLALLLGLSRA